MQTLARAIGVMLCVLATPRVAEACSFRPRPPEAHVDGAEFIFIARVVAAAEVQGISKDSDSSENPPVRAHFIVVDRLKGDPSKIPALRSGYGWGDCGVPFIVGRRYLIFTTSTGQVFISNGTVDITPEYEPHGKFIQAIRQYIKDGTRIPVTSNPFVQLAGEERQAADKKR